MKMPFGKYEGIEIHLICTDYLVWALAQYWFREKYLFHYQKVRYIVVSRLIEEMPRVEAEKIGNKIDRNNAIVKDLV